ncbi:PCYCGC motif-containing (lipo)protein [Bacillus sp. S13(2024)]|uniref:PCYCGC motif-containing (lipo)protein n=1 Tax=unclassified Bacillus (in: firmicutes) TaxID=185979 RepID=UPI003D1F4127
MQQIYQIEKQNHELLTRTLCYCGCGESAGHQSNVGFSCYDMCSLYAEIIKLFNLQ